MRKLSLQRSNRRQGIMIVSPQLPGFAQHGIKVLECYVLKIDTVAAVCLQKLPYRFLPTLKIEPEIKSTLGIRKRLCFIQPYGFIKNLGVWGHGNNIIMFCFGLILFNNVNRDTGVCQGIHKTCSNRTTADTSTED